MNAVTGVSNPVAAPLRGALRLPIDPLLVLATLGRTPKVGDVVEVTIAVALLLVATRIGWIHW